MKTTIDPTSFALPEGCSARAGELSDYTSAFELMNAMSQYSYARNDSNDPELVRLDWQNSNFNPQTDVHIVFDPDGKPAGYIEVWLDSLPPVNPSNRISVRPDYLGKGLFEYLLTWGENRSRGALEQVPAGLRVAARAGAEHTNQPAIQAMQSLGWGYLRSFYRMETNLDSEPEVPATPQGFVIRPYDPATETEALYRAIQDSFRDHFGFVEQPFEHGFADFKHYFINDPGYDPSLFFIAVAGNEIAGVCICRLVDPEDPESGRVNELGVLRAWRKQGLGFILLKQAFAAFYARGQKRAGLYVDASSLTGAVGLYKRAGMRVVSQFDSFEKELRAGQEISTRVLS